MHDLAYIEFSRVVRKADLNIIYAEYMWPAHLDNWKTNYPVNKTYPQFLNSIKDTTGNVDSGVNAPSEQGDKNDIDIYYKSDSLFDNVDYTDLCNTIPQERQYIGNSKDSRKNVETALKPTKQSWFYAPEYSNSRQQYEVTCVDSTHLLTQSRQKCCKGGLRGLSNLPWRNGAKSYATPLSLAMIDCILNQCRHL